MTPCTTPGHSTRKWLPVASALPCPTGGEASRPVQIAYVPAFPSCAHGRVSLFFVQSEGSPMTTKTTPTAPWRSRIVGSGEEAPDQLIANPANWRIHSGAQRDALRGSLDTVGGVATVLVNRRTGFVVDGHARVEEALSRHEATVPPPTPRAPRAYRARPLRRSLTRRGSARPRDSRPDRGDGDRGHGEARRTAGGHHRGRRGAACSARRPGQQRSEGGPDRARRHTGAIRGALRQDGRPVGTRRASPPVRG